MTDALELYKHWCFHPLAVERWMPREILETLVYDVEAATACGFEENIGFFVLHRQDGEEWIAYQDREGDPQEPICETSFYGWYEFGPAPQQLPDGLDTRRIFSSMAMKSAFRFTNEHLDVQKDVVEAVQIGTRIFTFKKVEENLYELLLVQTDTKA